MILAFLLFSSNAFSEELMFQCKRFNIDSSGWHSLSGAESWYPKNLLVRINLDKEKAYLGSTNKYQSKISVKSNGTRIDLNFPIRSSSGNINKLAFYFLPNGEVHVGLKPKAGYVDTGGAKYKCDGWPMNVLSQEKSFPSPDTVPDPLSVK